MTIDVRRLGHATLETPDLARSVAYYEQILGLTTIDRTTDRAVLATSNGWETIVLEQGTAADLRRIAFQIAPTVSLTAAAEALAAVGVTSEIRSGITPGVAKAVVFTDPRGMTVELYNAYEFARIHPAPAAFTVHKLGHIAYFLTDIEGAVAFYRDVLGFRESDWRKGNSMFMRCGPDHHTINFFRRDKAELAHLAFEVKDWPEMQRACDYIVGRGMLMDWGPSRHNIGHNIACYHRNPDGIRIELYTEMDQMKDEALGYFEPRPWHEDLPQRPKDWPLTTTRNYWATWGP